MPVLVVQMGHVGRISGATGAPGEMQFTQRVGDACARLLGGGAWSVRVVPADPVRASYRGDAFVAVHADGNNNPAVAGASVGYQTPEGGALARAWRDAYVALGWAGRWNPDNYTANLAGYYGVSYAVGQGNRRACIVECGTITNLTEREAMTSQAGVDRAALAIGRAVGIIAAGPAPAPVVDYERTDDVTVVTCATPNRAGLLLDNGVLVNITGDTTARGNAQRLINAKVWPELEVTEPTWNALVDGAGLAPQAG